MQLARCSQVVIHSFPLPLPAHSFLFLTLYYELEPLGAWAKGKGESCPASPGATLILPEVSQLPPAYSSAARRRTSAELWTFRGRLPNHSASPNPTGRIRVLGTRSVLGEWWWLLCCFLVSWAYGARNWAWRPRHWRLTGCSLWLLQTVRSCQTGAGKGEIGQKPQASFTLQNPKFCQGTCLWDKPGAERSRQESGSQTVLTQGGQSRRLHHLYLPPGQPHHQTWRTRQNWVPNPRGRGWGTTHGVVL